MSGDREVHVDADVTLGAGDLEGKDLDAVQVVGDRSETKDEYLRQLRDRANEVLNREERNEVEYSKTILAKLDRDKELELGKSAPNVRALRKFVQRKLEALRDDSIGSTRSQLAQLEQIVQEIFVERTSEVIAQREREIQAADEDHRERIRRIHDRYDELLRPDVDAARDLRRTLGVLLQQKIEAINVSHTKAIHSIRDDLKGRGHA